MTDQERIAEIETIVSRLSEIVDVSQVLTCWITPEGDTVNYYVGAGNWYARRGMAIEFLDVDQARTLSKVIHEDEE